MKLRFEIGEVVYVARLETEEEQLPCPDCGGTRALRVTLYNGVEHSIACEACKHGYEGPRGYIVRYAPTPKASSTRITGVDTRDGSVQWQTELGYRDDADVFDNMGDAFARALDLGEKFERDEKARITQRSNAERSWAWNVTYHRREIREAKRRLAHHEAALSFAVNQKKAEAVDKASARP
jgi:predicted RNA-binding Zn-ribbon protein involved in translation (DUF1610 family)